MAFDIIYKGQLTGNQVDFQTGNLTDISTFDTDVRSSAIQNQIVSGVLDRGASQDAIYAMSGYLADNAHPSVTPASNVNIDLSDGYVVQDLSLLFDGSGHVTGSSSDSVNLDNRYVQTGAFDTDITTLSGLITGNDADITTLSGLITGNDADITTLSGLITGNDADIVTLSGLITGNDADIVTLSGLITGNDATLTADITTLSGLITGNDADIVTLSGLITGNDADITTLSGLITGNDADIVTLSGLITGNDADIVTLSGLITGNANDIATLTLDDVVQNGSTTSGDIEVQSLRVSGDGSSASITGPATITIDPDSAGAAGLVVIAGDLQVDGTTTTINSTSVQIDDFSLILGTGAPNNESADGAGIIIDGTGAETIAEFTYDGTNDRWTTNGLDIEADIVGVATGADAWTTARTITLDGDVTGIVTIDGSSNQTLTTTIEEDSVTNDMLVNTSVSITGGDGLAGGGNATLGGSAVTLSISAGEGLTANTDSLDLNLDGLTLSKSSSGLRVKVLGITSAELANSAVVSGKIAPDAIGPTHLNDAIAGDNVTITNGVLSVTDANIQAGITGAASSIVADNLTASRALVSDANGKVDVATATLAELNHLTGVSSSVQDQLDAKALESITITGSNGLTGGGDLSNNRALTTVSDQGHLDEIELGTVNSAEQNIVTKGGILILRGTGQNGITTSGDDGQAIDLTLQTTVAFEGVVQSMDTSNADGDGENVAMWKIQGILQRNDADMSMLSSHVINTYKGSGATAYDISVSVGASGLSIASDQALENIMTSATLNYNSIQYTA